MEGVANAIRAVVLGEADPSTLGEFGINIAFTASGVSITEPSGVQTVSASVADVATGYVAAWAAGSDSLSRWAHVILGLPALDLGALEDSADGEDLLEAVWEAAGGGADGLGLATRLAGE